MKNLGTLAKGINIGDMAVSVLATEATKKGCGRGLFHDTTLKGTRVANMINNYRYTSAYYNIVDKLSVTDSKRFFYGKLLSAPNIDGIDIGWGYNTDINQHTLNIGYVSSADFSKFQKLLRDNTLQHGRQGYEYQDLYKVNLDSNLFVSKNIPTYERGDEIILNFDYKQPKKLETILSLNDLKGRNTILKHNTWLYSKGGAYGIEGSSDSNLEQP